ncbi:MAG: preprotein translocase subunit YajC [Actinobacteria bacterium]|nr:preprotein translocase subunit YajC [Actinomycetota bacterium]
MHLLTFLASADSGSEQSAGAGAVIVQLGIFLLIPVAMYFLLIRPQRRRQREQAAMQSSIDVGDEIMTTSGVYGFITGFDGDICWLEVDDNVQIRIARAAIQRKVDTAAGETAVPVDDGSGKGTKIEPAASSTPIAEDKTDR